MTTFANQLKSEIARLAKKEVRAETAQLKRASAHYRSDIAALKRQVTALEASLKKLAKNLPTQAQTSTSDDASALRFRADGFTSLRKKFQLTASQMGKLVGVSAQSIYHWETGKSRPRASQLPAIAAVRKLSKTQARSSLGI